MSASSVRDWVVRIYFGCSIDEGFSIADVITLLALAKSDDLGVQPVVQSLWHDSSSDEAIDLCAHHCVAVFSPINPNVSMATAIAAPPAFVNL